MVAVSLVDLARGGEGAGGEERLFDQEIAAVKAVLGLLDIHVGQRRMYIIFLLNLGAKTI